MKQSPDSYKSYLVRVWREEHDGQVIWRASVESVQTGERQNFASVEGLFTFLRRQIEMATSLDVKD